MTTPATGTHVGEVLEAAGDAVVIVDGERVIAWSPGAAELFGISREEALAPGAAPLREHVRSLLAVPADGVAVRMPLAPYGVLEVRRRPVGEHQMLLMRDVSVEVRRSEGLRRLSRLSHGLLAEPDPTVPGVLATVAHAAREMTGAATGVVLLLAGGGEAGHVVHDGPEALTGHEELLAAPALARRPLRVDDLAGDGPAAGVAPPYPAVGPLCAVPLVAGVDVLGTLAISSPAGGRVFDAVDQELLVDLAAHASVAIRWAQGIEKEQARTKLRSEIIRTARHDIRNPLGAGKGYVNLLLTRADRMTPEQVQMSLTALKNSLERIETMTTALLSDEQLEVAGAHPQWAMVPLQPLLEGLRQDAEVMAGRPDAVVLQLDPAAPEAVAGDPGMVREMVDNLVGNALKHGGAAGAVHVVVLPAGARVRIEVRDSGPGIPVEEQAALFERWSRLDSARRSGTSGFGLGLSIVKRLVEAHGGEVGVDSEPGRGATFWVTLPTEIPVRA